jgi:hypothetical protein
MLTAKKDFPEFSAKSLFLSATGKQVMFNWRRAFFRYLWNGDADGEVVD